MMRSDFALAVVASLGAAAGAARCDAQARTFTVSRPASAERFLHVTLDFGGGTLVVMPAASGQLYGMTLRYDGERSAPIQQYDPRTGILHIGLEPAAGSGIEVAARAATTQTARVELSADLPLSLFANVGAGDAALDLGGMMLAELEVRGTASRVTIDVSRPTRGDCRSATFMVAAAELTAQHLARAGCDTIRVGGGVGGVVLAFDGAWRRDAILVVDLSMGGLTLQLPRGTGLTITADRFLAPLDGQGLVRNGQTWVSPGFDQSAHKLRVDMKAAMVKTRIEWQ